MKLMKQVSMVRLMGAAKLDYVEEFGVLFEQFGLARMVGRVLGVLLIFDPPERSAEELAEVLRASRRGSINPATRTLVQMGACGTPDEARRSARLLPGKTRSWRELMRWEMEALTTFRHMAERGLGEMHDFYAYWEREMSSVLERWEKEEKR